MKKTILLLTMWLTTLMSASATVDPNFQIYLCFGQSNMEGNATIEEVDRTGVDDRFLSMAAMDDERLGWVKGQWHKALPPLARPTTGLTPVDYFGRTLVARLPQAVRVGVITVAVGGADIALFDPDKCDAYLKTRTPPTGSATSLTPTATTPTAASSNWPSGPSNKVSSRASCCTRVRPTTDSKTGRRR